jgi:DNA-binding LacI/PurR family transcriptional regulator
MQSAPGISTGRGRTTIHAVASLAGVSPSTVSRALNSPELVKAATRQRVLATAEQLGYQPNRAARSLVLGRTACLGLIVPDIANPFFTPFIKAVQSYTRAEDYALFLADTDEDQGTEVTLANAMARQVDGLILCSPRMSNSQLRAVAELTSIVVAHRLSRSVPSVAMESGTGIRQAVSHVHGLGHRRCAYLAGPRASWSDQQKRKAYEAACAKHGIELTVLGPYEPRFPGGYRAADDALAADVTAVFAYNDLVALGVLSRLGDRGVVVPDEMSVIGFDDIAMASMSSPPLTTVAVPITTVAAASASMLLASLVGGSSPRRPAPRELETSLVIRSTTAPTSAAAAGA